MLKSANLSGQFNSERAAKRAAGKDWSPIIVKFNDGTFEWYPLGQRIGEWKNGQFIEAVNFQVVSQYQFSQWRRCKH